MTNYNIANIDRETICSSIVAALQEFAKQCGCSKNMDWDEVTKACLSSPGLVLRYVPGTLYRGVINA